MRIRISVPDSLVGPKTVQPALESVTKLNEALMGSGIVPTFSHSLAKGRVMWRPEPKGHGEHFDAADTVLSRGWGDCDDLAPWYAAELRARGIDPGARVVIKRSGPQRWHALVRRSSGEIEDPSRAAGMPSHSDHMVVGAIDRHMRQGAPYVDVSRWDGGGWLGRADLPIDDAISLSHYALASDPATALTEAAISGACHGVIHGLDRDAAVLGAVAQLCAGCDIDEVSDQWESEVGSIFSAISKAAEAVAKAPSEAVKAATKAAEQATKTATGLATGLTSNIPFVGPAAAGLLSPLLAQASGFPSAALSMPGIQSVLQAGLPLASQLLPWMIPGGGIAAQMGIPMLQQILSSGLMQPGVATPR